MISCLGVCRLQWDSCDPLWTREPEDGSCTLTEWCIQYPRQFWSWDGPRRSWNLSALEMRTWIPELGSQAKPMHGSYSHINLNLQWLRVNLWVIYVTTTSLSFLLHKTWVILTWSGGENTTKGVCQALSRRPALKKSSTQPRITLTVMA